MDLPVISYINKVEGQCWHALQDYSLNHPQTARFLSVAVAVGTLIKWIFQFPVFGVQNIILAFRGLRDYTNALKIYNQNQNVVYKQELLKKGVSHLFKGIGSLTVGIPIGILCGIFFATQLFLSTLLHPLKTAKIKAGESDLNTLLAPLIDDFDELVPPSKWDESEITVIVKNLFERQKNHVESLTNDEEIAHYQFLDEDSVKNAVEYKLRRLAATQRRLFIYAQRAFREDEGADNERIRLYRGENLLAGQIRRIGSQEQHLLRLKRWFAQEVIPQNQALDPDPAMV